MTVRFKFRSSVDFDTVDIDGRPSISVRDLRVKIVEQKNLKVCQDSDLVISDAVTGQAYENEDYPVRDGSSVIIKRVPAGGSAPSVLPSIDSVEDRVAKHTSFIATVVSSPSANEDMDNFDDFGVDLYPVPEGSLSDSEPDVGKVNCINSEKADNVAQRCSEPSISRCQNFEPSDLSEAIPRAGMLQKQSEKGFDAKEDAMQANLKSKTEEHKKLDEELDTSSPTVPTTDLPSELRCSLCNSIFKEAVMIPCCQHSFCNKCIRLVLIEKARCPKCSSTKFKVEDLLPNVSLRQAIEHFLESQVLISGSDNIIPRYAPDGESGIQAKEVSCAMSILQREPLLPHSPSATGKGSNLVMTEPANESLIRKNKVQPGTGSRIIRLDSNKSANSALHRTKQTRNGDEKDADACPAYFKGTPEGLKDMVDFQGDSEPFKLPQAMRQEEANSASKKNKGLWANTADGTGNFMATSRHRKGDRTCYMCGSPDHFVRDCPAASSPYPMLQTGDAVFPGSISPYGPPYWHGAQLPHVRPYSNLYGTPGVMPFDPTMVPVGPFGIPPYMPSMYASMPVPCGFMMGGLAPPVVASAERPLSREEFMEFQDSGRKRRVLNEHPQREHSLHGDGLEEGYHYSEPQRRSHDRKPHLNREDTRSYSEDNDNPKSQKKHPHDKHSDSFPRRQRLVVTSDDEDIHSVDRKNGKASHFSVAGRDQKSYHSAKSNSGIQDASDVSERHSRERLKHHRRSCSKKHSERRGQCASDSSRKSHHRSRRETSDDRKNVELDVKRHSRKRHGHSETFLEPSYSDDRKRQRREKEHPRHKGQAIDDQLEHDRWEMVDGLDYDYGDDYHYHKRKRIH